MDATRSSPHSVTGADPGPLVGSGFKIPVRMVQISIIIEKKSKNIFSACILGLGWVGLYQQFHTRIFDPWYGAQGMILHNIDCNLKKSDPDMTGGVRAI